MTALDERKYFEREAVSFKFGKMVSSGFVSSFASLISNVIFKLYRLGKKNSSKRILIISLARLGDTVFTIPAIKTIQRKFKNFRILIICYPESRTIYELVLQNIEIRTINKSDFYFGRRFAKSGARRVIEQLRPEIIFDLTGTVSSATLICSSHARNVVGTNSRLARSVYTHFGIRRLKPHLMDSYVDIISLFEDVYEDEKEYIFPANIEKDKTIMIHPFAIREAKEWDLNKYIELAVSLKKNLYRVAIVSPEGFLEEKDFDKIRKAGLQIIITPTLEVLISTLRQASVFISNDSGPIHIASLLGKPTYTIFGPTNPAYSAPFGTHHRFYTRNIDCSPKENEQQCYTLAGIYCSHHKCLRELPVEEIETSVINFLEQLEIKKIP